MKKLSFIIAVAMIFTMLMPIGVMADSSTTSSRINVASKAYFEDFEGLTDIKTNTVGFSSTEDKFGIGTSTENGNALSVNYKASSGSKAILAPKTNNTFAIDAASFEAKSGAILEYGYDVYIPTTVYTAEQLIGYMVFADANGTAGQFFSAAPGFISGSGAMNIRFANQTVASTQYAANSVGTYAYTAHDATSAKWVSIKARVTYETENGKNYYVTTYFVDGVAKAGATLKVEELDEPVGTRYLQFSINGNSGENNPNNILVDNMFIRVLNKGSITANQGFTETFDGISSLSEVASGYGQFTMAETNLNGQGLVRTTATAAAKATYIPYVNSAYAFTVDASAFETAGKELEYGYDIYIPAGTAVSKQSMVWLRVHDGTTANVKQYIGDLPQLTGNGASFRVIDQTHSGQYAANSPGSDGIKTITRDTTKTGWVNLKARLSYVNGDDGSGYYITRYYIDNELVKIDGKPVMFKIKEEAAPSGTRSMSFHIQMYDGTDATENIIVDNVFAKLVDSNAEDDIRLSVAENTATCKYLNYGVALPYQLIVAGYDANNRLVDVTYTDAATFAANSMGTVSKTLSTAATTYKAFLWESLVSGKPIVDAK
ncbi:MAG: hypothetical protein IKW64_06525 [Clostridia bacterium]|nr:hypothetical protein [Clostridia bacterium]